jgi:hypothetical protein
MPNPSKSPWPTTYLGRLQAVTEELRKIGAPSSATALAERFAGVTSEEVESMLAALILFGRVEKVGEDFQALEEDGK